MGVGQFLILADKWGRRGLDPPCLADIICEQSQRGFQRFGGRLGVSLLVNNDTVCRTLPATRLIRASLCGDR